MDAIDVLKTRRCVRAYTAEPVARQVIEDIVDCGRLAATARNDQPWEFVVIENRRMLTRLGEIASYGKFIPKAAACIAVFCKSSVWYLEDGCAASQNILLAAHAHGLGACWVDGDKKPYAETVRQELGAPEGYKLVSLIPIGHPAELPRIEKRQLSEVLHWESF